MKKVTSKPFSFKLSGLKFSSKLTWYMMTNKILFVCLDWLLLWVCAYMFDWVIFFLKTWSFFFKKKKQMFDDVCVWITWLIVQFFFVFQNFKSMVELQLNTKVKSIQSNWGGEYRPFSSHLASFSISHRLICLDTHHQNGVVERKHKHIVDLGLTLVHHASLPLQF